MVLKMMRNIPGKQEWSSARPPIFLDSKWTINRKLQFSYVPIPTYLVFIETQTGSLLERMHAACRVKLRIFLFSVISTLLSRVKVAIGPSRM